MKHDNIPAMLPSLPEEFVINVLNSFNVAKYLYFCCGHLKTSRVS